MTDNKILRAAASDGLFLGLYVFLAGFVLISVSGFRTAGSGGAMRILHTVPALVASGILLVHAFARMIIFLTAPKQEGRGAPLRLAGIYISFGCALMAAGIIISSLTRFEASMVLTEGQDFGDGGAGYTEGSVYSRRFSNPPDMKITMLQVTPALYNNGRDVLNLKAQFGYENRLSGNKKILYCNSLVPLFADGIFFRASNFGYSPHYRISSPAGEVLDEAFIIMKLFPPGSEDSFRIPIMPETFYLRYYPEGSRIQKDTITSAGERQGAFYQLRIARNLDLIVPSRPVAAGEQVGMGPMLISFDEPRRWVKIKVVKDAGLYFLGPGIFIALATALWGGYQRINSIMLMREWADEHDSNR